MCEAHLNIPFLHDILINDERTDPYCCDMGGKRLILLQTKCKMLWNFHWIQLDTAHTMRDKTGVKWLPIRLADQWEAETRTMLITDGMHIHLTWVPQVLYWRQPLLMEGFYFRLSRRHFACMAINLDMKFDLSLTLSQCTLAGPVYTGIPLVDPVYTGTPLEKLS